MTTKELWRAVVPFNARRWLYEQRLRLKRSLRTFRRDVDLGSLRRTTPVCTDGGRSRGQCVDRYYIKQFLAEHAADVRGHVLEFQDDFYARTYGGTKVTRVDVLHFTKDNPQATIIGDLASGENIPSNTFDCIICTQVLLLIYDIHSAVRTLYRSLKPGGIVLVTVPGVAHKISRADMEQGGDYWRFTTRSLRRLFEEVFPKNNIEVKACGNVLAAIAFLHGFAVEDLRREDLEYNDPDYEVSIALRAVKPNQVLTAPQSPADDAGLSNSLTESIDGIMNNKSRVSVVISFLNAGRFLEEAIESVFAQTFKRWELLLVDDGSSDSSSQIARRYSAEHPHIVKYLEHHNHRNRGLPASRNLGIRSATGDYVALLDSDDVWLPGKLEQQVAILDSHSEVAMVSGATQYWRSWAGNSSNQQRDYVQGSNIPANRIYEPPALLKLSLSSQAAAPCPSDLLFRRESILNLGGFDEAFSAVSGMYEDIAFLVKVYSNLPVFVSDECWDRYRLHSDSLCARVKRAGQDQAARAFYLNWLVQYLPSQGTYDAELKKLVQRELWRCQHPWLNRLWRAGPALVRRVKRFGTTLRGS